jgi:hypothetical protein
LEAKNINWTQIHADAHRLKKSMRLKAEGSKGSADSADGLERKEKNQSADYADYADRSSD